MVILPGHFIMKWWVTQTKLMDNCLLAMLELGYSNNKLSLEWIKHFYKFNCQSQTNCTWLLLLDGYISHCTFKFLEHCNSNNIIVFCLPSHTTHLLQPSDVVLFQPYKHWHAKAINKAIRTGCDNFNKIEFLYYLGSICQQTFKSSSIKSAFRQTGFISYNPAVVLE